MDTGAKGVPQSNAGCDGKLKRVFKLDLIAKLEKKQALLHDMLDSTNAMGRMAREGNVQALSNEADRRQKIIDEIDTVDDALAKEEGNASKGRQTREAIQQLLYKIAAADRQVRTDAQYKKKELGEKLRGVKQTKKGIEGYASPFVKKGSIYIDAKK